MTTEQGETAPRCPSCGALVRADAPWCTQCFFDLRPAPEPEPEPLPAIAAQRLPPAAPSYPDPLTDPLPGTAEEAPADGPTWPCGTCGVANPLSESVCSACGSGFLAAVREGEAPLLVLPGVGDLTRLSRGQRFAVAGGVVVAVLLVVFVLGLLLS